MKQIRRLAGISLCSVLLMGLLAACGAGSQQVVTPAGAAQGQATFLYFYTDV